MGKHLQNAAVFFGFGSLMPVEPPISFLILDGVDSHLGALAAAGRNSQIKPVGTAATSLPEAASNTARRGGT
jgi:hypothetical protein